PCGAATPTPTSSPVCTSRTTAASPERRTATRKRGATLPEVSAAFCAVAFLAGLASCRSLITSTPTATTRANATASSTGPVPERTPSNGEAAGARWEEGLADAAPEVSAASCEAVAAAPGSHGGAADPPAADAPLPEAEPQTRVPRGSSKPF